jgi:hypothetical protein
LFVFILAVAIEDSAFPAQEKATPDLNAYSINIFFAALAISRFRASKTTATANEKEVQRRTVAPPDQHLKPLGAMRLRDRGSIRADHPAPARAEVAAGRNDAITTAPAASTEAAATETTAAKAAAAASTAAATTATAAARISRRAASRQQQRGRADDADAINAKQRDRCQAACQDAFSRSVLSHSWVSHVCEAERRRYCRVVSVKGKGFVSA